MDSSDVIALVAGVISAASAWYAHRIAGLERGRRHDERTPKVTLAPTIELPKVDVDGTFLLSTLRNEGPDDYDEVHVELIGDYGPATGVRMRPTEPLARRVMAGSILLGESKPLMLEPAPDNCGTIAVKIEVHMQGEVWRVLRETDRTPPVFSPSIRRL